MLLAAVVVPTALFATQGRETGEARINARKLEDGRVEFAIQVKEGNAWSERILPQGRYFPADASVGRWLNSTPVEFSNARDLPVLSPWMRLVDSAFQGQSIAVCSGWNCNALGLETDQLSTLILVGGTSDDSRFDSISLHISCAMPNVGCDHGGCTDVDDQKSVFEGRISITTDTSNPWMPFSWHPDEGESVNVLARRYAVDSAGDIELIKEQRFDLSSLSFDQDWLVGLRDYTGLSITFVSENGTTVRAHFLIDNMLTTPIQPNIDRCGEY